MRSCELRARLHLRQGSSLHLVKRAHPHPRVGWVREMSMSGCSTPPPAFRDDTPPLVPRPSTEAVDIVFTTAAGHDLGKLRLRREAKLIDVFEELMDLLGGHNGYSYQPVLVIGAGAFDGADQHPFRFADDSDEYILIKAPVRDRAFLDAARVVLPARIAPI